MSVSIAAPRATHRAVYLILNAALALICLSVLVIQLAWVLKDTHPHDLAPFVVSAQAAREGHNPYAVSPVGQPDTVNRNGPLSLLLFQPLVTLDFSTAEKWLVGVMLACYLAGLLLLRRLGRIAPTKLLWAFSSAPLWSTIYLHQIYPLLLLALVIALVSFPRRWLPALAIGAIIALKPNFALWSLLLLLAGESGVALRSLLVGCILTLLPVLAYGPSILTDWLGTIATFPMGLPTVLNGTLGNLTAHAGVSWLALPLSVVIVVLFAWQVHRVRPSFHVTSAAAIALTLIVSPISWPGYSLLLVPFLIVGPQSPLCLLASALLLLPMPLAYTLPSNWPLAFGPWFVWPPVLVLLAALAFPYARNVETESTGGS